MSNDSNQNSEKDSISEDEFRAKELHKVALSELSENAREIDKILLGLSVGGLGFILNLFLKEYTNQTELLSIMIFICAVFSYLFCVFLILRMFYLNTNYYQEIVKVRIGESLSTEIYIIEDKMNGLDTKAKYSFFIAIVLSAIFIVSITFSNAKINSNDKSINKIEIKELNNGTIK